MRCEAASSMSARRDGSVATVQYSPEALLSGWVVAREVVASLDRIESWDGVVPKNNSYAGLL